MPGIQLQIGARSTVHTSWVGRWQYTWAHDASVFFWQPFSQPQSLPDLIVLWCVGWSNTTTSESVSSLVVLSVIRWACFRHLANFWYTISDTSMYLSLRLPQLVLVDGGHLNQLSAVLLSRSFLASSYFSYVSFHCIKAAFMDVPGFRAPPLLPPALLPHPIPATVAVLNWDKLTAAFISWVFGSKWI